LIAALVALTGGESMEGKSTNYKTSDVILYATHGVCEILEVAEKNLRGTPMEYYVLKPLYYDKCTIYVPVGNEELVSKMRRLLSVSDIYALIEAMPSESAIWIEDEYVRVEQYKKILDIGDRTELVRLVKALYAHQQSQRSKGKKLSCVDDRFMKDAEKMLYEEFAHVLDIKREQVLPFIIERIRVKEKRAMVR
jgi:CarD family transcriptional regulator